MSISGINNYNYPNYYAGARHNMAKTGGRDSGVLSSTSSASSNITLHMSDGGNSGNALTAMGFPDGTSASVFKADDYNPADPEYRVRYWDKEGNYTDTNVQINGVNPRNASYLEMLAYTTYSDVEGFMKNAFGDFMNAARGVNGKISEVGNDYVVPSSIQQKAVKRYEERMAQLLKDGNWYRMA